MMRSRLGAVLWIACLQYFVAEAIAVWGWRGVYSFRDNYISDLGALGCSPSLCSPLHALMNGSFLLQGVLIVGGSTLLWRSLVVGRLSGLAMLLIGGSSVGVFLVGLAPEDGWPPLHYFGAAENFICCHLGMTVIGISFLARGAATRALGVVSLGAGLIGLTGLVLLEKGEYLGLGVGIIERIVAYPFPLWLAGMGARQLTAAGGMNGGRVRAGMRWAMAALYLIAGVGHLVHPAPFLAITPDWVPWPQAVIMVTGVCELAGAVALLTPRWRKLAGVMLALYAVCVYPANIKHALYAVQGSGLPTGWAYHAPRLALQPVLVWWALFAACVVDWPFAAAIRRRRADPGR